MSEGLCKIPEYGYLDQFTKKHLICLYEKTI